VLGLVGVADHRVELTQVDRVFLLPGQPRGYFFPRAPASVLIGLRR